MKGPWWVRYTNPNLRRLGLQWTGSHFQRHCEQLLDCPVWAAAVLHKICLVSGRTMDQSSNSCLGANNSEGMVEQGMNMDYWMDSVAPSKCHSTFLKHNPYLDLHSSGALAAFFFFPSLKVLQLDTDRILKNISTHFTKMTPSTSPFCITISSHHSTMNSRAHGG